MRVYRLLLILGISLVSGCDSITGPLGADGGPRFAAIYTAAVHSCALTASGEAYCWGSNLSGDLGFEPLTAEVSPPVKVHTGLRFKALGLGSRSCGLTANGDLYCWGQGSPVPARMFPDRRFSRIARSVGHSDCAVSLDGEAVCWGFLYNGCDPASCEDLRVVPTAEPIVSIASGNWQTLGGSHDPFPFRGHGCGLSAGGTVHCWGENGRTGGNAPITEFGFVAVETGPRDTCALDGEGFAYCWGVIFGPTPTRVADIRFSGISLGGANACGVTPDGRVYCWGGTSGETQIPVKVAGDVKLASVSVSPLHACGLTSEGEVYCWGSNIRGQVGIPTGVGTNQFQPIQKVVFGDPG